MAPGRFLLIVTNNPTAADIFKVEELLDNGVTEIGATRRVKKPSWSACSGKIISIGTKKALSLLKVSSSGELIPPEDTQSASVLNRFQELAKRKRMHDSSAREEHVREVSERLLRSGPSDQINYTTGRSNLRLPKRRPESELESLQQALKKLRCLTKHVGDVALSSDQEIYLNGSALLMEQNLNSTSPSLLLNGILGRLIPMEVSSNKGLSRTGKRGTVPIPPAILEAANVSVLDYFHKKGVAVDPEKYNIKKCVKNFLYYKQNKSTSATVTSPLSSPLSSPISSPISSPTSSPRVPSTAPSTSFSDESASSLPSLRSTICADEIMLEGPSVTAVTSKDSIYLVNPDSSLVPLQILDANL